MGSDAQAQGGRLEHGGVLAHRDERPRGHVPALGGDAAEGQGQRHPGVGPPGGGIGQRPGGDRAKREGEDRGGGLVEDDAIAAPVRSYVAKVEEYLSAAEHELEAGRAIAATSLAIHAGIDAADAVCDTRLGRRAGVRTTTRRSRCFVRPGPTV